MKISAGRKALIPIMTLILAISIHFSVSPFTSHYAQAEASGLEQIRVALFIDVRGTVPTVTLSSQGRLEIGSRQPSGTHHWISHSPGQKIRVSIDQYMLKLPETSDYGQARTLLEKLNNDAGEAYILNKSIRGKEIYQVYAGQYASNEEAVAAKKKLHNRFSHITITGPYHWNAGTYSTEQEALKQLAALSGKGLDVNLVIHENNIGNPVYSVWLGEAVNLPQLNAIKEEAADPMPGLKLKPVDRDQPYLLKRQEVLAGNSVIPHYFFNGSSQKVWLSAGNSSIKVEERYGRTYRGNIELSQYHGQMAVINQLPFEQYLYSVVGSEMIKGWPIEALKAQAVAARTYALKMDMKYQIAHISDTTYEQAYKGKTVEFPSAVAAVKATSGEVLVNNEGLITPFYYSNAGGVTAAPEEVWETPLDYIKSVPSPDEGAQEGELLWDHVVLPNGTIGYIRTDFTKETNQQTSAGFAILRGIGTNVNVRLAPYVNNSRNAPIAKVNEGDRLIRFEQTMESNAFNWIRGPYSADELEQAISRISEVTGELKTLEISKRGPSGRVTEMKANGRVIEVSASDSYRTAMNGLPSTRFDVEQTGSYTILGADHQERTLPQDNEPLYALGAEGSQSERMDLPKMFAMNAKGQTRLFSQQPLFRFVGFGFGHGLGMSQWGAKNLAEFVGYDYQKILKYYYHGVEIVKD